MTKDVVYQYFSIPEKMHTMETGILEIVSCVE